MFEAHRVEPVVQTRVLMRDHDTENAILVRLLLSLIDAGRSIGVVKGVP